MRAVFIGAGSLAVMTARLMLKRGHEVVMIERDKARIEALSDELDCGFLNGDGAKPAIQREADPEHTDILFCLTGNDQANILASLVGRSLGFPRVVTKIEDPELEHICIELGLEDTIIPNRTIGRHLADLSEGQDPLELSTMIRDEARAFSFVVHEPDAVPVEELALPEGARVVAVYRAGRFIVPDETTR
ncbi:MAG: NAD-binding protein, partial [Chromatiales bacterium]|nr:NAD-binding protein [Chromatiales bacterium]